MPRISSEKKEARRLQILEAAWRRFQRQGIHATSMQDIIAESGLSAGAVYLYFPSKESLIEQAVATSLATLAQRLLSVFADRSIITVPALTQRIAEEIVAFARRETYDMRKIALLGWGEALRNRALFERMQAAYGQFRAQLQAAIAAMPDAPADSRASAKLALSIVLGFVVQSALMDDIEPEDLLA